MTRWFKKVEIGNYIGLVTTCLSGIHPEISMLTSEEFSSDDTIFLYNITNSILTGKMEYYDHFIFYGIDEDPDVEAFMIIDPGDSSRLRLIKTRRPFYTESLKITI